MELFINPLTHAIAVWIGVMIVFFAFYAIFTRVMRWMERRHPEVFRKYLPQYLEEDKP